MTAPLPIGGDPAKFNEADFAHLAVTPGGIHLLGTTPGGTKIKYERSMLMKLRESPLSKTPLKDLPHIHTKEDDEMDRKRAAEKEAEIEKAAEKKKAAEAHHDDDMFAME